MSNRNLSNKGTSRVPLLWLVIACLLVFGFWVFYPTSIIDFFFGKAVNGGESYSIRGQFGDQFGALSSLFSGLAFAGIIYTILLQRDDLNSTREEVERQNKLSEKQAFENTLFQMLFARQEILKNLDILGNNGRRALDTFYRKIVHSDRDFPVFIALKPLSKDDVREIKSGKSADNFEGKGLSEADISVISESFSERPTALDAFLDSGADDQIVKLRVACQKAISEFLDELSHYIRYTFWIYKYIDNSPILTGLERRDYSDIVRSQLSDIEVATIFYFVVVPEDFSGWSSEPVSFMDMKALVKEYDIVGNLNDRFVIHNLHKKLSEK